MKVNFKVWQWALHWQVLLGLILGVALGYISGVGCVDAKNATEQLHQKIDYKTYSFLGSMFLSALKMLVVPLVVSALVSAMISMGRKEGFSRLGLKTLAFYLSTSTIAIIIGLVLVNFIEPGVSSDGALLSVEQTSAFQGEIADLQERVAGKTGGDFFDIFKKMLPPNIIQAAANGQMLGLIVFALLFGWAASKLTNNLYRSQEEFWESVYQSMIKITHLVLRFTPIGVAALLATTTASSMASLGSDARLIELLGRIVMFSITVVLGLSIHVFVIMPLILRFIGKARPLAHFKAMSPALLTAFSTASSAATLPVTMDCVEQRSGVSKKCSSFVLPLGATVNMDGTALYECVAAIFIAQLYGIEIGMATQFFIVMIALLTSIGVAGVPSASLVAIIIILQSVGVPMEGLAVIMVVDRILDMCRTSVNVYSDSCGAVVLSHSEKEISAVSIKNNNS